MGEIADNKKKLQPINIEMWQHDGSEKERGIVKLSWKIMNAKRYEAMTPGQRKNLISMIERFEKVLEVTKEQLRP